MIGLASRPGTAVLPTWWMPPRPTGPIASFECRSLFLESGRATQGSYATIRIGSSLGVTISYRLSADLVPYRDAAGGGFLCGCLLLGCRS